MWTTVLRLARTAVRVVADLCRRLFGSSDQEAPNVAIPDLPALVGGAAGAAAGLGLPLLAGAGLAAYALAVHERADEPALVPLTVGGLVGFAAVALPLGVALGLAVLALAAGVGGCVWTPDVAAELT